THVTVKHSPHDQELPVDNAPKTMIAWGVLDGDDNTGKISNILYDGTDDAWQLVGRKRTPTLSGGNWTFLPLAWIHYDVHSRFRTQTFPVFDYILRSGIDFGVIVVEIVENWGGVSTCLEEVMVHG
ncbi:hypothetical protein BJ138DRAFT_991513, partial [Hygrophoropsis aurantiaca]